MFPHEDFFFPLQLPLNDYNPLPERIIQMWGKSDLAEVDKGGKEDHPVQGIFHPNQPRSWENISHVLWALRWYFMTTSSDNSG